jgi:hypothetical protein
MNQGPGGKTIWRVTGDHGGLILDVISNWVLGMVVTAV